MPVDWLGHLREIFSNGLRVEHNICLVGTFATGKISYCFRIFRLLSMVLVWLSMLGHLRHDCF